MVKIFNFLFFFVGIGSSLGNPPNITCLDSSVFLFTMAVDVPQKREILFLGNQKTLSEKESEKTVSKDIDIFLIVTDSAFGIKKKLVFGDPNREDVAEKVLVDSLGNYVILSQVKKLSPYEVPIALPTMLTIINSKYEIISQNRFYGYGFTIEESKGGYIIFGSSTELGEEIQVYMAQVKDNVEVWKKNIAVKNSIFGRDKVHTTKEKAFAYVSTKEQFNNMSSSNKTTSIFKHGLIIIDSGGNIIHNTDLKGIPKYTYINEWYLKDKYLYLLLTNMEGGIENDRNKDKHGFAKYDLETHQIVIQFLGEYSKATSFFPVDLIDFEDHISAISIVSYEKKSALTLIKWENVEVFKEEWPDHPQFFLFTIGINKKGIVILPRNSSGFYFNSLLVKKI